MPKINFRKEKKTVECEPGENLRLVAIKNGIELYPNLKKYLNCRGHSSCGECRVYVINGLENLTPPTTMEKLRVGLSWFKFGHEHEVRLACQCQVQGDIDVLTQPEFNWLGER